MLGDCCSVAHMLEESWGFCHYMQTLLSLKGASKTWLGMVLEGSHHSRHRGAVALHGGGGGAGVLLHGSIE